MDDSAGKVWLTGRILVCKLLCFALELGSLLVLSRVGSRVCITKLHSFNPKPGFMQRSSAYVHPHFGPICLPVLSSAAYIRVYRLVDSGKRLELVHKTTVDGGVPGALSGFKGRLLAGVGPTLRLYDMGKKKLLRKCEYNRFVWDHSKKVR